MKTTLSKKHETNTMKINNVILRNQSVRNCEKKVN